MVQVGDSFFVRIIESIEENVENESSKIKIFEDIIGYFDLEQVEEYLDMSDSFYTAYQNILGDSDESQECDEEEI